VTNFQLKGNNTYHVVRRIFLNIYNIDKFSKIPYIFMCLTGVHTSQHKQWLY